MYGDKNIRKYCRRNIYVETTRVVFLHKYKIYFGGKQLYTVRFN